MNFVVTLDSTIWHCLSHLWGLILIMLSWGSGGPPVFKTPWCHVPLGWHSLPPPDKSLNMPTLHLGCCSAKEVRQVGTQTWILLSWGPCRHASGAQSLCAQSLRCFEPHGDLEGRTIICMSGSLTSLFLIPRGIISPLQMTFQSFSWGWHF